LKSFFEKTNIVHSVLKTISIFLLLTTQAWAGATVSEWLSTADQSNNLTQQANLSFAPDSGTNTYTITLNDTQTNQTIDGFGAAMCDSSAYVMYNELTTAQRAAAMTAMFDPNNGIGLSMCRLPMGASDMAVSNYSYDDNGGAADPTMAHFSIAHDMAYIIPCMQQMLAINPNVKIMATPWSPPGWMKDSGTMKGGNFLPQYYSAYAQYFVKFVQAYQAQGIPIWSVSCQNEPLYNATGYPGMNFPATQELEFIRDYLGPAFEAAGLTTKILVYDHNWDQYVYPETVLGDAVANFFSLGTAWHWYGGVVTNQQYLQTLYPGRPQYITEAASGTWNGNYGQNIVNDEEQLVIWGSENWSKGAIKWPFALDQNAGPQNGGCNTCYGLITVNTTSQTFSEGVGYFSLGQASKFVQRGAYYVNSNSFGSGAIEDAAFKNPDGSDVVVVLNSSGSTQSFKVVLNGQSFTSSLPASGVATYKWTGGVVIPQPTATPTPNAASAWRIHAGGGAYTDSLGNVWAADENFVGGAPATNTGTITGSLPGSGDQALYENERYGASLLYNFQAPNQLYQVTLKFSENYWTSAGSRVFNVMINGNTVLTNFDIFAAAGGEFKAVDKVFNNIQPDSQGRIIVQLGPTSADNAKIDAIQIIPQPGAATFTPTATMTSTPTATLTPTPITLSTWRVNAGGPQYTDSLGHVWSADENFTGGTAAVTTSTIASALPGAADQTIYQSQRYGNPFSYTFNVPAGSYQLTLKFAETYWTASGKRTFNVLVNGATVLSNFDIFATAGAQNKAIDEMFNNILPSGGVITIQFGPAGADNAEVQGIQIVPMPATATFTPTFTKTNTVTSTYSSTPSYTATNSFTATPTNTLSATATDSMTPTASFTATPSNTSTNTVINTATPANTSTSTATNTYTSTFSPTGTPTSSSTATTTFTASFTGTFTPSATTTNTSAGSVTPINTNSPTGTSTATLSNTPTSTNSMTSTSTFTSSFTATSTPTATNTLTATWTPTNTQFVPTSTFSFTLTPSATPTNTATKTATSTSTNSFTATPTATLTPTATFTVTKTFTATATVTNTRTFTATQFIPTSTFTPTKTNTPIPATATKTATPASGCSGNPNWNGNFVYYPIGSKVDYNGEIYQCVQAHTSEPTWEPNVVPALWKDLGACGSVPAVVVAQPVVYPNPVTSDTLSIQLPVSNSTNVSVGVYTVAMRQVKTVSVPQVFGDTMTVQAIDKAGIKLANGLYYFMIQANGQKWMSKVLVLR